MEGKTPVSALQELSSKRGVIPSYNLILDGVGTHEPVFKFEVTVGSKSAIGSGKSKKEAKHNAASQLLNKLKDDELKIDSNDLASPYDGVLKENAVGDLSDFCIANNLRSPEYKLTRDEGLPHAKVFSWSCTVSSFTTEGTAKTKKNAKQVASHEMLIKLKQYLADIIDSDTNEHSLNAPPQRDTVDYMTKTVDDVIKMIPPSLKKKITSTNRLGVNLADVCHSLKDDQYPGLDYLDSLTKMTATERQNLGNLEKVLDKIVEELQTYYDLEIVNSSNPAHTSYCLEINTVPSWTFIATGDTPAIAREKIFFEAVDFMINMR